MDFLRLDSIRDLLTREYKVSCSCGRHLPVCHLFCTVHGASPSPGPHTGAGLSGDITDAFPQHHGGKRSYRAVLYGRARFACLPGKTQSPRPVSRPARKGFQSLPIHVFPTYFVVPRLTGRLTRACAGLSPTPLSRLYMIPAPFFDVWPAEYGSPFL